MRLLVRLDASHRLLIKALLLVMRAVLDGDLGDDAGVRHCEGVLRMLGVADDEVEDIARRANEAVTPA